MHQLHQIISADATVPTIVSPESGNPGGYEHQRRRKQLEYLYPTERPVSSSSPIVNSSTNMPLSDTHSFPGTLQNSSNSMSNRFISGNNDTLSFPNGGNAFHSSFEVPYSLYSRLYNVVEQQSTDFTAGGNVVSTSGDPLQFPSGHSDYASVVSGRSAEREAGPTGHQPFNQLLIPGTPTNTDMTNAPTASSEMSPRISNATGPVWSVNGGEPMIRDGSRFSRNSTFSYLPTPVLRNPAGDASVRDGRSLTKACQPTVATTSLDYELSMSQQPTFTGFSTQPSNNQRLEVPLARSSSTRSAAPGVASASASASNMRFSVSQDTNVSAIPHRLSDASSSVAISPSQTSYIRPFHEKVTCQICKVTFKGDHELRRHKQREHSSRRSVWVTHDSSPDGTFLAGCKACASGKLYKVDYNAAAHLRRIHFHPRERKENGKDTNGSVGGTNGCRNVRSKSKKGSDKKRGGKAGGSDPPMSVLKKYWMREVVELVPQETANTEEEEDVGDGSVRSSMTSDDDCDGLSVDSKGFFGAGNAHTPGSNAIGNDKKDRNSKTKSIDKDKSKRKGKSKAIGKGKDMSKSKSSISQSNKPTNGGSHTKAHSNDNTSGNSDSWRNCNRDLANPMSSINDFYNKLPIDLAQPMQIPIPSTTPSSVNLNSNDDQKSMLDWMDIDNFDFDNTGIPLNTMQDNEEEQLQMQEQPIGSWSVGATAGGQMSQPHTSMSVDSIASRAASAAAAAPMSASMFGAAAAVGILNVATDSASINAIAADAAPSASSQSAIQFVGAGLSHEEPFSELEGVDWV